MRVVVLMVALLAAQTAQAQTLEQYNDPAFWHRQKAVTQARDNQYGMTLAERANECEEQNYRVSREVTRAGDFIIRFHTMASPSRGYITPSAAGADKRQIITYAEVAHRDMRYAKYQGADVNRCVAIADHAITRIQSVLRKYPDFDSYDPNSDTIYGND